MNDNALVEAIARVVHESQRTFCAALGDPSQPAWEELTDEQRAATVAGARFHIDNPHHPFTALHDHWRDNKRADGWEYGEVKDAEAKTHPGLAAFRDLSWEQQAKDRLFRAVVSSLWVPPT